MKTLVSNSNSSDHVQLCSFLDKVYLSIEYNSDDHFVYNNWMGHVTVKNVMAGAEACLKMLQEYKCSKLLNDNREVVGRWTDANDWIENDWTPRAVNSGLLYFAHIVTPGIYAEASALNMQERVSGKFNMKLFSDIEEAKIWLNCF